LPGGSRSLGLIKVSIARHASDKPRGHAKQRQRAGIEHAKQSGDRAYLGRKPSFKREQFVQVRAMLGQEAVGIAQIAKETGLTRQTVYRIKSDPTGAKVALAAWGL
jgi:putative DNA-invertase from lambdoid prophage Rac